MPRASIYWGRRKVPTMLQLLSSIHLLPNDLRFEHGDAKLASCPGRHLTSKRPWTQQLEMWPACGSVVSASVSVLVDLEFDSRPGPNKTLKLARQHSCLAHGVQKSCSYTLSRVLLLLCPLRCIVVSMVSAIARVSQACMAWRYKTWLLHSAKNTNKINQLKLVVSRLPRRLLLHDSNRILTDLYNGIWHLLSWGNYLTCLVNLEQVHRLL